jgi:hypothetical protein
MCVLAALEEQESHGECGGGRDRCRRECAEAGEARAALRARTAELAGLQQPRGRVAEALAEKGTTWIGVGCPSDVRPSSVASAVARSNSASSTEVGRFVITIFALGSRNVDREAIHFHVVALANHRLGCSSRDRIYPGLRE